MAAALISLVCTTSLLGTEQYFSFDTGVQENFSREAADWSYAPLYAANVLPLAVVGTSGESQGVKSRAAALYGLAVTTNYGLTVAVKFATKRPRPYMYNPHPSVRAFAKDRGVDNHLSFYSGHSSASFVAASAGSILGGRTIADPTMRRFYWGTEFAMASSAAILRVRAGKHYYTDIIVGAVAGIGVGAIFGASQDSPEEARSRNGSAEIVAGTLGVAVGTIAYWLPFGDELALGGNKNRFELTPVVVGRSVGVRINTAL